MSSSSVRHKNQAAVKIKLAGEETFDAVVFLSIGDRLIDLLNDNRAFIPVKKSDGEIIIIAKTQISSIIEKEADEDTMEPEDLKEDASQKPRKFDAYEILRIAPDATIPEIRSAYKSRLKAVHPDSIASLGLDEDLTKAALHTTQKVNYAYRKIMKEREDFSTKVSGADQREAS